MFVYFLIATTWFFTACEDSKPQRSASRPSETEEVPGYLNRTVQTVEPGKPAVIAIGRSKLSVKSIAEVAEVSLETLVSAPVREVLTALGSAVGDVVKITFFEKESGRTFSSDILPEPYDLIQTLDEGVALTNLKYVMISAPDTDAEEIRVLSGSGIEDLTVDATATSRTVQSSYSLTDVIIYAVESDTTPAAVIVVENTTDLSSAGGAIVATSNLAPPTAVDDGTSHSQFDSSPTISWSPSISDEVAGYEVAIGSEAGLSDIKAWTNVGNETTTIMTGLSLTAGMTYYAAVRAVGADGEFSTLAIGDGWLVGIETFGLKLRATNNHACAVIDGSEVKCWGYNERGQLGQGHANDIGDASGEMGDNLAAIDLGSDQRVMDVALNESSTCALLEDGTLRCFGISGFDVLGWSPGGNSSVGVTPSQMGSSLPEVRLSLDEKVIAIASGYNHSCVILSDRSVKCFGRGGARQLGYGDPVSDTSSFDWLENPDNLPTVDLGTNNYAKAIAVGYSFSCAIFTNNGLKCWGNDSYGELGLEGNAEAVAQMGDQLGTVDLGSGEYAKAIALGYNHACAILKENRVKCWGSNSFGQLGLGDVFNRGGNTGDMGDNLPYVDLGENRTAQELALNLYFSCALLDNGQVKCWGENASGNLGQADQFGSLGGNIGASPGEMGDSLPPIDLGTGRTAEQITAGYNFVCAVLDDDSVKCWGRNFYGNLGLGDKVNRGEQPGSMGDNLPSLDL